MTPTDQSAKDKVWFITGCSTGFGRELAKQTLDRGFRTVVTARDPAKVEDIAKGRDDRALVLELDVTDPVEVDASVKSAAKRFGRIDVLVNNAGIGYFGAVEESDETEVRRMFEINFFGLSRMTRAVLPIMRQQRSGHIVNISSIGGLRSFPSLAYYHATKYAVEGFSESLSLEVAPLGIKVTIVEPSGFRTDWPDDQRPRAKRESPTTRRQQAKTCRISGPIAASRPVILSVPQRPSSPPSNLPIRPYGCSSAKQRSKEHAVSSIC
jgi:NAD(P)-dependent dehydrogenase (short-subunit alcohol dehydrogenase family)